MQNGPGVQKVKVDAFLEKNRRADILLYLFLRIVHRNKKREREREGWQ